VADDLPFSRMIFHMGGSREMPDLRKRDAAFSTLEHLVLHAKHSGVTICVENTTSEMGAPAFLRSFVDDTRLPLRFNFDIGHAHLADGPESDRVDAGFAPLRDLVASVPVHDNHGEKDEHLPPYGGSIDWESAVKTLKGAPGKDLALMLELKEKTGPEAPSAQEQLEGARKSLDRLLEEWG
jgi:sugar phosphate isomerase/epimerase